VRFGEKLNFFFPFGSFDHFTWPATLQIILKNDAKCSFSEVRCNMLSQRFQNYDLGPLEAQDQGFL
jgi:hypothetical protein